MINGTQLAKMFHEIYEKLAPNFGYETREATKEFNETTPNGKLMIATCDRVLEMIRTENIPLDAEVKPAACDRCKELEELLSKYKYDMDAYFNPHYCFGYLYSEYKQQKPRFEKLLGIGTHSYIIEQQVNTLLTILEGKLPSKLSV